MRLFVFISSSRASVFNSEPSLIGTLVWRLSIVAVFFSLTLASISANVMASGITMTTYSVGVVPQFEHRKLRAIWKPILAALQKQTGFKFIMSNIDSISSFGQEFNEGTYDIGYSNPLQFVQANALQGYIPLIHDGERMLFGIIVVAKDSPIRSVEDLQDAHLAFPSPNALGASLLIKAELEKQFNISFKSKYVKTHSSVYIHVIKGLSGVSAGGGVMGTYLRQREAIQKGLRILYQTRKVPPHPISVHPRVPHAHQKIIRQALIEMAASETGSRLLALVPIRGATPAKTHEYLFLRDLNLEKFMTR